MSKYPSLYGILLAFFLYSGTSTSPQTNFPPFTVFAPWHNADGMLLCILLGRSDGTDEGVVEGTLEGTDDGEDEGILEGTDDGVDEGISDGALDGTVDGFIDGTDEPLHK